MRNTRARLAGQSTDGRLDHARLLDRLVRDRDRTVGHRAFETFERPRGFFFAQEAS